MSLEESDNTLLTDEEISRYLETLSMDEPAVVEQKEIKMWAHSEKNVRTTHFNGCSCISINNICDMCPGGCKSSRTYRNKCICTRQPHTIKFECHYKGCTCSRESIIKNLKCDYCPCGSGLKDVECQHELPFFEKPLATVEFSLHFVGPSPRKCTRGPNHHRGCTCKNLAYTCGCCPFGCMASKPFFKNCICERVEGVKSFERHFRGCTCTELELIMNVPCYRCPCGSGIRNCVCIHDLYGNHISISL